MRHIKVISETRNTVTLRKADFEKLLKAAEDAVDASAVRAHRAQEKRLGWDAVRRMYLAREEAERRIRALTKIC
jgi:hypothetical protein